jgi:methylenetetrahydrofolate reductase (NADPH)
MFIGFSRFCHKLCLNRGKKFYFLIQKLCRKVRRNQNGSFFLKTRDTWPKFYFLTVRTRRLALADVAYLCRCCNAGNISATRCGGSFKDGVEVYPEKENVFMFGLFRLKQTMKRALETVLSNLVLGFIQNSSWINFYLGRDHTSKR